jgi:hypothetical protein
MSNDDLGLEETGNPYDVRKKTKTERTTLSDKMRGSFNKHLRTAGRVPRYTIDFAPYKPEIFFGVQGVNSARAKLGYLAENNFGKKFHIFKADSNEIVGEAKLHYKWDDPVWKAKEHCPQLWRAIVNLALTDAAGQVRDYQTSKERDALQAEARLYCKSAFFDHDCEAGDLDPDYVKRKVTASGIGKDIQF